MTLPNVLSDKYFIIWLANHNRQPERNYLALLPTPIVSPLLIGRTVTNPVSNTRFISLDDLFTVLDQQKSKETLKERLTQLGIGSQTDDQLRVINLYTKRQKNKLTLHREEAAKLDDDLTFLLELEQVALSAVDRFSQLKIKSAKYLYQLTMTDFTLDRLPLGGLTEQNRFEPIMIYSRYSGYRVQDTLAPELLFKLRQLLEDRGAIEEREYVVLKSGFDLHVMEYLPSRLAFESRDDLQEYVKLIDPQMVVIEEYVSAEWVLYQEAFDYRLLTDWLMNGDHTTFFYGNDPDQPQATTGKEQLFFKDPQYTIPAKKTGGSDNYLQIKIDLNRQEVEGIRKDKMVDGTEVEYGTKTPYLLLALNGAPNRAHAKAIQLLVMGLLLKFIKEKQGTLLNEYQRQWSDFVLTTISRTRKINDRNTGLDRLKAIAPEVFVEGYAAICQKAHPIYLTFEEAVKLWKDKANKKEILPYPKTTFPGYDHRRFPTNQAGIDERFAELDYRHQYETHVINNNNIEDAKKYAAPYHFTCDDPVYTHIGIRPNKLSNQDQFEYFPCCFIKKQFDPNSKSYYNEFYNGIEKAKTDLNYIYTTEKRLVGGKKGKVFPAIETIFNRSQLLTKTDTLYRVGVLKSIHSFLHLLYYVREGSDYLVKINAAADSDQYVRELRQEVAADDRFLLAARQELYDRTLEEVRLSLNSEEYLDSRLYYRCFEEYFGWNIYCFVVPRVVVNAERGAVISNGYLEQANSKGGSIRHHRPDRPTILLLKHWGKPTDPNGEPHYEVIVREDASKKLTFAFDDDPFHASYLTLNNSWWFNGLKPGRLAPQYYLNLYSSYSLIPLLLSEGSIEGQYLDDYGHARGFLFVRHKVRLTIFCQPHQSQALPAVTTVERTTLEVALELFGGKGNVLTRISTGANGLLTGVWFDLAGNPNGIYLPLLPPAPSSLLEQLLKLPVSANPWQPDLDPKSTLVAYEDAETKLRNFMFILTWLYKLYLNDHVAATPNDFITHFNFDPNSNRYQIPDTLAFKSQLNFDEALNYINKMTKGTLSDGESILFHDQELQTAMEYYVKQYCATHDLQQWQPQQLAVERKIETTPLFATQRGLLRWIELRLYEEQAYDDPRRIDPNREIPQVFCYKQGKFYLTQAVFEGSLKLALTVAAYWRQHSANLGYYAKPPMGTSYKINENQQHYLIYRTNEIGELVAVKQEGEQVLSPPLLLLLVENKHVALLPLTI